MKRPTETQGDWEVYARWVEEMLLEWYGDLAVESEMDARDYEKYKGCGCLACRTHDWFMENFEEE